MLPIQYRKCNLQILFPYQKYLLTVFILMNSPYLGRNADLAIEDAALLAKLLSDDSLNIEQAFRLLYEKRVSKTDKVLTTSVRMGKYELAKSKIGCFFRNLMYKAAHKTGFTHISIARKYYSATEDIFEYLI
jgi:2-polyprenyl-6-methoxyphenol hydroxylase-like FAD-dependent oxidoreductase